MPELDGNEIDKAKGFTKELFALNELRNRQTLVNGGHHSFESIDQEEAVAATYTFIQFCTLTGLGYHKKLQDLKKNLELDQKIIRKGLKTHLNKTQKEAIWLIRNSIIKRMKESMQFTKNYSRKVIQDYLDNNPDDTIIRNINFAFIDEVQDLTALI